MPKKMTRKFMREHTEYVHVYINGVTPEGIRGPDREFMGKANQLTMEMDSYINDYPEIVRLCVDVAVNPKRTSGILFCKEE